MRIGNYSSRAIVTGILMMGTLTAQAQQENMDTILDFHHILAYLVATFLISVFVMIFYNRLIYFREKDVTKEAERLIVQLSLVLDANKTQIWAYDIEKDYYTQFSGKDNKETTYIPIDFAQAYDREDFYSLQKAINSIKDEKSSLEILVMKSADQKESTEPQRVYEVNVSILRQDWRGIPTVLLGTQRDITQEQLRAENTKKLMLRHHTVFESSLVDMVFYDQNGILTEVNDKALETFGVEDRQALIDQKVNMKDILPYREMDLQTLEATHLSSITNVTQVKQTDERVPQIHVEGKMYYEATLGPIRDKDNNLKGIIVAGRDITDMVESNHHQKEAALLLEKRTNEIQEYIQNINYSLKVSNVRLVYYYPDRHELEVMSDLSHTQYCLTQIRVITMIQQEDRRKAKRLMMKMDHRNKATLSETLRTIFHDEQGRDVYLNFRIMPVQDNNGTVTHYLGMYRDVTEMTYTEKRLQVETAKAQEEEQLKNTFLLNMSYELRTPLNAVIGFAELFGAEHNEEDEPIFAEEIKKNTNTLLKLINDILFLSRLDARMIEFNYQEADFAMLFEGWCYMGWSNLAPDVKVVVENPYNSLLVTIDQQNLSTVIQKLCIYTGQNTLEGTVRAKYEYHHGELTITIEDTGKGLDAVGLKKAFERFAHKEGSEDSNTGLDLPIVRELIEQMNGTIELQSEPGKGSSFFVSIPCEMSALEKKAEITV